MKLTVFGATGGTGSQVVSQAPNAGHEVTAVVRDPARLPVSHGQEPGSRRLVMVSAIGPSPTRAEGGPTREPKGAPPDN